MQRVVTIALVIAMCSLSACPMRGSRSRFPFPTYDPEGPHVWGPKAEAENPDVIVLRIPLNLSNAGLASKGAQPVSILRQGRSETGHEVAGQTEWPAPLEGVQTSIFGSPTIFATHVRYSEDPRIWVADSFEQALRNAGYEVRSTDSIANARTPVVVSAELRDVSVERESLETSKGLMYREKCNLELHLLVKALVRSKPGLERTFDVKASLWPGSPGGNPCDTDTVTRLVIGGLGEAINQALPAIAPVLNEVGPSSGSLPQVMITAHPL